MPTYQDVIDSRDLLNELRELLEDSSYDYTDDPTDREDDGTAVWPAFFELPGEDQQHVQALRELLAELPESTIDSPHGNSWGCTLIHEDHFTDYARELAKDIGAISGDESWPLSYVNWPAAAEALKADYATVELDGQTYYAR